MSFREAPCAQQEIFTCNPFEREMSAGLALDQEQLGDQLLSGHSVCQVFTPQSSRLQRLDIVTKNRTDPSPGRISLWSWQGSYDETVAAEPLWQADLQFHGPDAPYVRHYFPRVAVEPGRQYMIECSRPGEWFYMAGVKRDAYANGFALSDGKQRPDWDLWFRTFGPAPNGQPIEVVPRPLPEVPERKPTPPRPPAEVTRDIYLGMVREYVSRSWQSWEREHGRRASELMFYTGFLFRRAGEPGWAERVPQWLADALVHLREHDAEDISPWYVDQMGWGIKWYRGNQHWTEEAEQCAREVMLMATRRLWRTPERGAMNRAMWDVLGTRLAVELYPDAPEAEEWRRFSDEAWHDWADFDDTDEDSSHYNAVFLHFMLSYVQLTARQDAFQRPGMRQFMDRCRDLIAPAGMMVGWGDSVGYGADWGAWVAAFEAAASATGDGTYKWAAHALLDGHRRNILEDDPLQKGYEDMRSIPLAYVAANDEIKPVQPELKSRVLTAAYPRYNPPQVRKEKGLPYYSLEEREVPWKLVMRDGPTDAAYYGLFGLLPGGGHGHADAPALLALAASGTLLMHDTAYFHKNWPDHNLLYAVRVDPGEIGPAPTETRVVRFEETDTLCYADIAWQDYAGWGLDLRREILFVKGLGWWVRDRTEAKLESEWFLGPLWHVDRIAGRGASWFDADYAVPMSFAWPAANGTDHLLVYFTPKADASVDYADMTHRVDPERPWYSSAPSAVYQCEGPRVASPEHQAHYNSLLLPLHADVPAEGVADAIEVLLDEAGASVIRIPLGDTTWTLALNDDGRGLELAGTLVDARAAVIRETPRGERTVELVTR
jgi:hypothetical protein